MLKSVWLSSLAADSLNDRGSVLYSYFGHLREMTGAKNCMMCLFEPDGAGKTYFHITPETACVVPLPGIAADEEAVKRVTDKKQSETFGGRLYCPLFFESVASFGVLVFEPAGEIAEPGKLREALIAFSTLMYSESMGSILRSFHDTALRAEGVCVDYRHGNMVHRVVKNVDLEICEKEFTIIAGASGSGKSTLLNVFGGMLSASEGRVIWKDKLISEMSEKERTAYRAKDIGFIFQRYNLINDLTAEENIGVAASLADDPLPIKQVLEMVGLGNKGRSYPFQMSGGEQQRVCIARALVKKAKMMLCDEPTGALDTDNAAQVISILKNISKEQGIPVVVITHNPSLVVLADHCITLSNGTVIEDVFQPFALSATDLKLR